MRFTLLSTLVGLAVGALAQSSTADSFVASESPIAHAGLLANLGPSGSKSQGAKVSLVHDAPERFPPRAAWNAHT